MTTPADATTDEQLIARTREGDMSAYDELYRRHVDDASKVARIVTNNSDEAQDVVAEAFTRVLTKLREGGGPDTELTPYLRTVVRRLAIDRHRTSQRGQVADPAILDILPHTDDPMARATAGHLVRDAFETLPERWQQVLWHTEVEGRSAASLTPALGGSPNAVAALAYRAREGLRQAYMAANVTGDVLPECRPYAPKIASFVRGTLSAHDTREMSAHLAQCTHCRERRDELLLLVSDMRGVLWPALLLPASGVGAAVVAGAGAAGGGILAFLSPTKWGKQARQIAASSTAVAAAAAIAVAAYVAVSDDAPVAPPAAAPPISAEPNEPPPDEPDPQPQPDPEQPPPDEPVEPPAEEPAEVPVNEPEPEQEPPPADPAPPEDEPPADPAPPEDPPADPAPPEEPPAEEPPASPEPPVEQQAPAIEQQPPANPVVVAGEPITLRVEVSGNPPPQLQWQYAETLPDEPAAEEPPDEPADPPVESPGSVVLALLEDRSDAAPEPTPGPADLTSEETPGSETPGPGETPGEEPPGEDPGEELPDEGDWIDVRGATSETLVIDELTAEHDGRAYRVQATNSLGSITTEPSVLDVQYAPEITDPPDDVQVEEGGQAVFEAAAVANPDQMSVAWQFREPDGEWVGAGSDDDVRSEGTTTTLELDDVDTDLDGYQYRAVFANEVGETTSEPATLTVHWAPKITENPDNVRVLAGEDAEFVADASAKPEASWHWESAPEEDGPWTELPDATGEPGTEATLTVEDVTAADHGTRYRAVFTNELGSAATEPAKLSVTPAGHLEVDLPFDDDPLCAQPHDDVLKVDDCAADPEPIWEVPGDGTIRWSDTGECLAVGAPHGSFFPAVLDDCSDSVSQQWDIDPYDGGYQKIKNGSFDHSMCLDVKGGGVIPGDVNELIVFPCHGLANQLFRFTGAPH